MIFLNSTEAEAVEWRVPPFPMCFLLTLPCTHSGPPCQHSTNRMGQAGGGGGGAGQLVMVTVVVTVSRESRDIVLLYSSELTHPWAKQEGVREERMLG